MIGNSRKLLRFDPQRPQRIQDNRNVDRLLQKRALHRGQVSERRGDHGQYRQANSGRHAFKRDPARALCDFDPGQQAIQMVDKQHNIGCLRRGSGPTRAHGDPHVGGRKRRRIVDTVAHHHDRTILVLSQDQENLLLWAQVGPDAV